VSTKYLRPSGNADELGQLTGWLDLQRACVRMKCEDLSEADAHRAVLPSSPLMTMAGIVAHLRWVEYSWFHLDLLGEPDEGQTPWNDDRDPDAEMRVEGRKLADLLDEYDEECARSRAIAARHSLGAVEKGQQHGDDPVTLRWILHHMIEETARHLGHMDAIREIIDGRTGCLSWGDSTPPAPQP
jgi:uncharacterized damage-inducible protein DinB